jgi:hypothetical protein
MAKANPSAVVFTHFGSARKGIRNINDYKPIFKRYLECNKTKKMLSIVYIYIDYALHAVVHRDYEYDKNNQILSIDPQVLAEENEMRNKLLAIETKTRHELGMERDLPHFQYVGIEELIELLNSIRDIDNSLVQYLAAPDGKFTYDSPKFVEAIIRIARGNHPFLAINPIIRIDEDAEPNAQGIRKLINAYMEMKNSSFFFFSGSYGIKNGGYDPLNDHAVRTHWFFPTGTKKSKTKNAKNPIVYPTGTTSKEIVEMFKKANLFLSDLTELGGKQKKDKYSVSLRTILGSGRKNKIVPESPQVISGAGLIMNHKAVSLLPPFMNFSTLTTWVDDHIKRSLHEAIGDIDYEDLLNVIDAKFKQDRHPNGIRCDNQFDDFAWAKNSYFERLLSGCLLDRIIMNLDRSATEYSECIEKITKYKCISLISKAQNKFNKKQIISPRSSHPLIPSMLQNVYERYDEVIKCWKSAEFVGTLSYEWAASKDNPSEKKRICEAIIKDALAYIDLVLVWPTFRSAILRLDIMSNFWLFRDIFR